MLLHSSRVSRLCQHFEVDRWHIFRLYFTVSSHRVHQSRAGPVLASNNYVFRFIVVSSVTHLHPRLSIDFSNHLLFGGYSTSSSRYQQTSFLRTETMTETSLHMSKFRRWLLQSPPAEWALNQLRELLIGSLRQGPIPRHVAFVMDGNRRFARNHKIETVEGHNLGFEALARV